MPTIELPYFPNILLIAGAGRNTGKTTLACTLIKNLSKTQSVTAIKISPHFHEINGDQIIIKDTKDFTITKEASDSNKDSSKMLQAGAETVYYIQVKQDKLSVAFNSLKSLLNNGPIICESGGLNQIIKPGLFLFTHRNNQIPPSKRTILQFNPIQIDVFNPENTFDSNEIIFKNNSFSLK